MRYFFHVDGLIRNRDSCGFEFDNREAAQTHAVEIAGELLKDSAKLFSSSGALSLVVADEDARTVSTIVTAAHAGTAIAP